MQFRHDAENKQSDNIIADAPDAYVEPLFWEFVKELNFVKRKEHGLDTTPLKEYMDRSDDLEEMHRVCLSRLYDASNVTCKTGSFEGPVLYDPFETYFQFVIGLGEEAYNEVLENPLGDKAISIKEEFQAMQDYHARFRDVFNEASDLLYCNPYAGATCPSTNAHSKYWEFVEVVQYGNHTDDQFDSVLLAELMNSYKDDLKAMHKFCLCSLYNAYSDSFETRSIQYSMTRYAFDTYTELVIGLGKKTYSEVLQNPLGDQALSIMEDYKDRCYHARFGNIFLKAETMLRRESFLQEVEPRMVAHLNDLLVEMQSAIHHIQSVKTSGTWRLVEDLASFEVSRLVQKSDAIANLGRHVPHFHSYLGEDEDGFGEYFEWTSKNQSSFIKRFVNHTKQE